MNLASIEHVLPLEEWERRKQLFAQMRQGDEQALAVARDEYGLRTLVLDGKRLIWGGVLIGARR